MDLAEWGITGESKIKVSHVSIPDLKMNVSFELKNKGILFSPIEKKKSAKDVLIEYNHHMRKDFEYIKKDFKCDDTDAMIKFGELSLQALLVDETYSEQQQCFFLMIHGFLKLKPESCFNFFDRFAPIIRQMIYVN